MLEGPDSPSAGQFIEDEILGPLLEWVRVLTDQWWAGRSIEGITGALHFVAPLGRDNRTLGHPTPVARFASATAKMVPISNALWLRAAEKAGSGIAPPAELSLATDAKYMLASGEHRSGVILGACAFEAARDAVLESRGLGVSDLKTSDTDLLKHLSVGFGRTFDRNLKLERPELFKKLTALWIARGAAAHGRSISWRHDGDVQPISHVPLPTLVSAIDDLVDWIISIKADRAGET